MAINRDLLRAKGSYFTATAGASAIIPFVATIALQFGGTPAVIGIMYSVIPFFVWICKLVFGGIVDKYQNKKLFLCVFTVISTCALLAIYFIPPLSEPTLATAIVSRTSDGNGAAVAVTVLCSESTIHGNSLMLCLSNEWLQGNKDAWPWSNVGNVSDAQEPSSITCDFACPLQSLNPEFLERHSPLINASRCHATSGSAQYKHDYYCLWTAVFDPDSSNRKEGKLGHVSVGRQCNTFSLVATTDPMDIGLFCSPYALKTTVLNCSLVGHCKRADGRDSLEALLPTSSVMTSSPSDLSSSDGLKGLNFNFQIRCLWICLIVGLGAGASGAMILDTLVIDMLEDKKMFGRQRLWGAIGWGTFSVISGYLVDLVSQSKSQLNFAPAFVLFIGFQVISMALIMTFRVRTTEKQKKIFRNVGSILCKPQIGVFTVTSFLYGCVTAINRTFLVVYLNKMGAPQALIGLALTVSCFLSEVPCFFVANVILKKIGHINCVSLSVFVMGIRLLLCSIIPNPWYVLLAQLAHGITFGLYLVTLSTFPALVAPPGIQTTMQGIFHGLYEGLGVGVGSLVGGALYQILGGKMMFFVAGLTSAGLSLTYTVVQYCLRKKFGDGYLYVKPESIKDVPEVEKMISGNDRELQEVDGALKEKLAVTEKGETVEEQAAVQKAETDGNLAICEP